MNDVVGIILPFRCWVEAAMNNILSVLIAQRSGDRKVFWSDKRRAQIGQCGRFSEVLQVSMPMVNGRCIFNQQFRAIDVEIGILEIVQFRIDVST